MMRTDIHRPSAPEFDPENYDFVTCFDLHPEQGDKKYRNEMIAKYTERGYRFAVAGSGCGHCGANIRYAALMLHSSTMEMMYVGEQCLTNRFESLSKAEFKQLREKAKLNRERATKAERIAAFVAANPSAQILIDFVDEHSTGAKSFGYYGPAFLLSLYDQLMAKTQLSEKQLAAIEPAIARDRQQVMRVKLREAAKQTLIEAGIRVPEGRVTVVGKIVSFKVQESEIYGDTTKMLVENAQGWKVYVTAPAGSGEANVGDEVSFSAILTPSQDDVLFAFGKRPTKFAITKTMEAK